MTRRSTETAEITVLLSTDAPTGELLRQKMPPGLIIEALYEHVHAGAIRQVLSWVSPTEGGRITEKVAQIAWTLETVLSTQVPQRAGLRAVFSVPAAHQRKLVRKVLAPLRGRPGVSIAYTTSMDSLRAIAKVEVMALRFPTAGGNRARAIPDHRG